MDEQMTEVSGGVSRRSMLKRGAVVGAAVVWTVPVIESISMTPASAASPSGAVPTDPGSPTAPPSQPTTAPPTQTSVQPTSTTKTSVPSQTTSTVKPATSASPSSGIDAESVRSNGTTGALANTGVTVPVAPTVLGGLAIAAAGAGLMAATRRPATAEDSDAAAE